MFWYGNRYEQRGEMYVSVIKYTNSYCSTNRVTQRDELREKIFSPTMRHPQGPLTDKLHISEDDALALKRVGVVQ